jgi:fumarate reductase subunit D
LEPHQAPLQQTAPDLGIVTVLVSAALATFAFFVVDVAADLLSPQPQDPLWLLKAATAFTNAFIIPVVGVLFLHLAAAVSPLADVGQRCRALASRAAILLALVFLLLLPILGFATWRGIANVKTASRQQVDQINRNAERVRVAIRKASSPKELQQFMVEQQGPQVTAEELNTPLAKLKQAKLLSVERVKFYYVGQIPGIRTEAYEPIFMQTLRTTALALTASLCFVSLAWNPNRQKSLLRLFLDFNAKAKARIANKLDSLKPTPDKKERNDRLIEQSRNKLSQSMLRNQREMNKSEQERKRNLANMAKQREKQIKKELEKQKKLNSNRKD